MQNYPSRLKMIFRLKSKPLLVSQINININIYIQKLDDLTKQNLQFKKVILKHNKLKPKIKFSLIKKSQTVIEEDFKQKEQIIQNNNFSSIQTVKEPIMRINTDLKKNNSACYISTTSKIQIKMNHTINYNIKE